MGHFLKTKKWIFIIEENSKMHLNSTGLMLRSPKISPFFSCLHSKQSLTMDGDDDDCSFHYHLSCPVEY